MQLTYSFRIKRASDGETLLTENTFGDALYIVRQGIVQIW
jgi:CRP-like cAMP-binding protein